MSVSERFQGANVIDAGRLSPYWGEHSARYVFSLPFIEKKTVLDIACGTGYGIAILKKQARHVTGVDVDAEAATQALVECDEGADVLLGNGLGLPFRDASFDVITSFETLEHLHERTIFLTELHRVLKPDGILLLSTPNANYSQPVDGKPANPFHIHEYTPGELRGELEELFVIKRFLGQTLDPATGIPPFYEAQKRLSKDTATQIRLFGWKMFNKIPFRLRERLSEMIWGKPFYPVEMDYNFDEQTVGEAVTLFAVCRKK